MNLVLDASAAIRIALGHGSAKMEDAVESADLIRVPVLFDFEVTNTAWKYASLAGWTIEQCAGLLGDVMEIPDERISGKELAHEVLKLGVSENRSTYDLFYVVVARRCGGMLATADKRLRTFAKKFGVETSP